jgi:hypothetical protein
LSPALEGHFAKYRKLVPVLALINHLADNGQRTVGRSALRRALAFSTYLETHAKRVYGAHSAAELMAAKAILTHVRNGELKDGFTAREIHRHDWSNLTDSEQIQTGLALLTELDYLLAASTATAGRQGGRPKITYIINPKVFR